MIGAMYTPRVKAYLLVLLMATGLSLLWTGIVPAQAGPLESQRNTTIVPAPIGSCPLFPSNNFWNTPVDQLPVHARSDQWVNTIGRSTGFHMDFGSGTWGGGPIGIPYNLVGSSVPKVSVSFYYPDESDPGPYPIPEDPHIEHGSDHHVLIVDTSTCTLYELYDVSTSGGEWQAGSGAIWDLNSNALRPEPWTSADAAGLPILPGLVRYEEVLSGEIDHAIRFTAQNTNGYIWPARHLTSNNPSAPHIPPMGARFRLKAAYNISGYPAQMQVILQAMKTYGIVLADNGSNWYVSGSPDERWDNDMLHLLDDLTGNDFEAVDTSLLMVDSDSGEANPVGSTTFVDVPASHPYFEDIEILYANGLTGGCGTAPLIFCPDDVMNRAQSAVFMVRGMLGAGYIPAAPVHKLGDNWTLGTWAEPWAEAIIDEELSTGCSTVPFLYCPWEQLPREQVVIFGLRMKYGVNYQPPAATGTLFADMTDPNYYATKWAEKAYLDGLLPGCGTSGGKPLFCPRDLVSRGLGAYIIVKAKNLTLP